MEQLPSAFLARMKDMLGEEYSAFLDSYDSPRKFGLRVNTLKLSAQEFAETAPFQLAPIPWVPNGSFMGKKTVPPDILFILPGCIISRSPAPWRLPAGLTSLLANMFWIYVLPREEKPLSWLPDFREKDFL